MKITILKLGWEFPPNSWGGLGNACYGLVKGLIHNGIKVKLVLPNKQKSFLNDCKIIHAPAIKHNIEKKYSKETSIKKKIYNTLYTNLFKRVSHYTTSCRNISDVENFDIIHAHDWMTFKAAIKIKKSKNKPLIVHVHSTEVDRQGINNIKKEIYNIEKNGMEIADKIIAVSNFTKKRIIKYYKISPKKIEVIHNAITLKRSGCNKKEIDKIKNLIKKQSEKINTNKKKFKVLFLGRLTAQKGPGYFIDTAHKILQSKNNVEFIVVGDGDMKNKIIKKATKLGISKNIIFTGYLQGCQIDSIYKLADVYVMPSVCEPFGLAPLESMKNGTPVILSKDAGVCEIIKNCLKVNYWNINQMAKKVIQLLESPLLHKKLSINGKKEIKKISWNKTAQKCKVLYKQILQN